GALGGCCGAGWVCVSCRQCAYRASGAVAGAVSDYPRCGGRGGAVFWAGTGSGRGYQNGAIAADRAGRRGVSGIGTASVGKVWRRLSVDAERRYVTCMAGCRLAPDQSTIAYDVDQANSGAAHGYHRLDTERSCCWFSGRSGTLAAVAFAGLQQTGLPEPPSPTRRLLPQRGRVEDGR